MIFETFEKTAAVSWVWSHLAYSRQLSMSRQLMNGLRRWARSTYA